MLRVSTPLILKPTAREKELLVPITPSSTPGVYGGICDDKQIKPVTICGYWYPSPYNPSEDKGKKVVLQFHGGAFVIGDSRPSQSGYAAGLLTRHVGKTLMVSYRLSSNPGGRFPAALQDALSALYYLIDLGVEYSDIVVSGDSAGGNIVVALLRHLSVANAPGPSAALLWSPWVDVAKSFTPEILYQSPHRWTDYIPPAFAIWGANTYCPKDAPVNMHDRWISPGPHPFYTKTPMWIQGNGQEILFEQIKEFANGMNLVEGNKIGFHNEETASHDILLVGNVTGFEKEAENAAKAAAEWLKLQQFISTK
ncbi:Alpha/Beta hydrolase protein [Tricladium varicosporioides]|nr:Alpha/Beta hydrolase protein [Hymenoscyphus varicosporioides]